MYGSIYIVTRTLVFGFVTIPDFEPDSIAPMCIQALLRRRLVVCRHGEGALRDDLSNLQ